MIVISQRSLYAHAQNPFCIDTTGAPQIPRIKGTHTRKEKKRREKLRPIRSNLLLHRHRQIAELYVPEFPDSKLRAIRSPSLPPSLNFGRSCTRHPKPVINLTYLLVSSFIIDLLASSFIICYQPLKRSIQVEILPKICMHTLLEHLQVCSACDPAKIFLTSKFS